jgi:hypothetical protein
MDPAIIAALRYPMPPAMPVIFEERIWQSTIAAEFERRAKQYIDSYAHYAADWSRRIDSVREAFPLKELDDLSKNGGFELLGRLAKEIEETAEDRGKIIGRVQKKSRRLVKDAFARDPSLGATLRSACNAIVEIEEGIIENLLDFALWVRGVRAMIDPDAKGGPVFGDAEELARYLDRETAA